MFGRKREIRELHYRLMAAGGKSALGDLQVSMKSNTLRGKLNVVTKDANEPSF